jgi:hypothetical protein
VARGVEIRFRTTEPRARLRILGEDEPHGHALEQLALVFAEDATGLGETTNRIIDEYDLPIPETFPRSGATPSSVQPAP